MKLDSLLTQGLGKTEKLWPSIEIAYEWVELGALILENEQQKESELVKDEFQLLMNSISQQKEQAGELKDAIGHFLKVTASYEDGLFHCYSVEGLPRTNNDLEQTFGSFRHHQRRCTGQKKSPASTVVRGSSRNYCSSSN